MLWRDPDGSVEQGWWPVELPPQVRQPAARLGAGGSTGVVPRTRRCSCGLREDVDVFTREQDPELDAFDGGCLALSRDGAVVGHVATVVSPFWSPGRPLTVQQRVWLVVVWADGEKERSEEDHPPWTYVREIRDGAFEWPYPGPQRGVYEAAWLPVDEREDAWARLGVTLDDF